MGKEKYKCENCNIEFYAYPNHRKGKYKFCSMKCQHIWRTGKTNIIKKKGLYKKCPICEREFYCYPSEIDSKKTCSKQCKYQLERIQGIHQGENCNFWTGGTDNYRGKNWYEQRNKALNRDKNTCRICGKNSHENGFNMSVHHIVPFRFFQNDYKKANSLENLISLCFNCHAKQESHQWHEVPKNYEHLLNGLRPCLKPPGGKRYSQEEIDFIKSNYNKMEYRELAKILNRPFLSVTDKICELNLKKERFTVFSKKDIELIKKYYETNPKKFIEKKIPHIKYSTIKAFANKNGLRKRIRVGLTDEEKEIVREFYPKYGINYVCSKIPYKTKSQIKTFIDSNKIHRKR